MPPEDQPESLGTPPQNLGATSGNKTSLFDSLRNIDWTAVQGGIRTTWKYAAIGFGYAKTAAGHARTTLKYVRKWGGLAFWGAGFYAAAWGLDKVDGMLPSWGKTPIETVVNVGRGGVHAAEGAFSFVENKVVGTFNYYVTDPLTCPGIVDAVQTKVKTEGVTREMLSGDQLKTITKCADYFPAQP